MLTYVSFTFSEIHEWIVHIFLGHSVHCKVKTNRHECKRNDISCKEIKQDGTWESWLGIRRAKDLHILSSRIQPQSLNPIQNMGYRNNQTLFTFTSNQGFYVYKRECWDSPFTKLLVLLPDHLNDISILENLRLFLCWIHPRPPDHIEATHYCASQGRQSASCTRLISAQEINPISLFVPGSNFFKRNGKNE